MSIVTHSTSSYANCSLDCATCVWIEEEPRILSLIICEGRSIVVATLHFRRMRKLLVWKLRNLSWIWRSRIPPLCDGRMARVWFQLKRLAGGTRKCWAPKRMGGEISWACTHNKCSTSFHSRTSVSAFKFGADEMVIATGVAKLVSLWIAPGFPTVLLRFSEWRRLHAILNGAPEAVG